MNFSKEQSLIIYSNFKTIAIILAYAGTGKSFTLKYFCAEHKDKNFIYFVYNGSMKKEAQKLFKEVENVVITTFHGIAMSRFCLYYFKEFGFKNAEELQQIYKERLLADKENKAFNLLPYIGDDIEEDTRDYYASLLLATLKDFTASAESIEDYLSKHRNRMKLGTYDDGESLAYTLSKLSLLWDDCINPKIKKLSFEHDFYLKMYQLKKPILSCDYILVDEAQDISPVMIDLILSQKSKKVFCGDDFQSIYSWRGAVNSLKYLQENYSPEVFYLSNSFRCPPKVAWVANRVIKMAGAEKEFVGVAQPSTVGKQITYIARTNSGLFDFCMDNLDKKIYFVGGISKYGLSDIIDVRNLLSKKHEYINNDFIKSFSDFKALLKFAKENHDVSTMGKIGIVLKYIESNLYDLVRTLKKECATSKVKEADLIVTTAHKSKGLEWAQVELLDDFPFSSEKKMERVNLGEELRLLYVAITRAQNNVRLPLSIIDYLDIGMSEEDYAPTLSAMDSEIVPTESLKNALKEALGEEPTQTNKKVKHEHLDNVEIVEYNEKKLSDCPFCDGGEIYTINTSTYCDMCNFKIETKKIIDFLNIFGKSYREFDVSMCVENMYTTFWLVEGLISNKNKPFDGRLIIKKHLQYGWQVSFQSK